MSRRATAFVIGYHGCRASVAGKALAGEALVRSEQSYDWLGPGVYFWENDPQRAGEWAEERYAGQEDGPTSVGALIDLGNCLDLTLRENIEYLKLAYADLAASGEPLPQNKDPKGQGEGDKLLRFLDCAVIRRVHTLIGLERLEPFDTVRGLFVEGEPVYPDARFHEKTHTQIAVLTAACIKAVFVPR